MRLKKLMAVACAAALTVTAFAGCSKKNDSSSGSDSKGDAKKEYYNAQPVDTGWEWGNVEIVDGGFIPDVIYNPTEEGLIYARTDMGGAYKYNKDTQRWECITDCFGGDDWNYNGTESLATDPVEPNRVYLAAGTYSTNNGAIFASDDYGKNWTICEMPFGMGGNEVGRGCGERLQVDP
ncbi:MAG TPA: cellulose-binding protein, partial [Ruminococcus bicirculans (ex Wegman et al. 2014)]|nr:cellulose-binding protein [Ruminococcus bicirculans (ex Wegman et al. 2014)]